jgi:predicted aspartyl protease
VESARLTLRGELAFVTATVTHTGATITVPDVLVDTGAASSVLNADIAADAGVFAGHEDRLRVLRGVGGREYVFVRRVNRFAIGIYGLDDFELEIGEMDYGFDLGGILGMDFLRASGAIIDLHNLTLVFAA